MTDSIYRQLAQHLDDSPNGFPATESGVELRLLAKLFTPEQAALACDLQLAGDTVPEIAERTGLAEHVAEERLQAMVDRGLIWGGAWGGVQRYGLMPFVVGFYEAQLPFMDVELAELVEAYMQESRGVVLLDAPSIQRVIPVGEAVDHDLEIYPYEQAAALIEKARSWAVQDCICRTQQKLIGKGCDRPIENCLIFAPTTGAFDNNKTARVITKEESLRILHEAEEAGLVHSTGNYRRGINYICNCCTCCCGVLRGVAEFDVPSAVASSDFWAVVDDELCIGCGACEERCQFGALSLSDAGIMTVDVQRCVGCGLCASTCPVEAIVLQRRPEDQRNTPPVNVTAWRKERNAARGLDSEA